MPDQSEQPQNNSGNSDKNPEYRQFDDPENQRKHKRLQQAGRLGKLGGFFGGRDEKAGNIAGLMAILCFAAIVTLLLVAALLDKWENVDATGAILGAILTACLGYLFGRK